MTARRCSDCLFLPKYLHVCERSGRVVSYVNRNRARVCSAFVPLCGFIWNDAGVVEEVEPLTLHDGRHSYQVRRTASVGASWH